jgi:mono/diheme cytochrome c family protein
MSARSIVVALALALLAPLSLVAQQGQGTGRAADRSSAQTGGAIDPNDEMQPAKLPTLPVGMTLDDIREGDRIFHGKGGCFVCHGQEAQGMPAAGDAITVGLTFIPTDWAAIDSLIAVGIPDAITRSPIAMPARGAKNNLTPEEIHRVAAYVWAISQTRGEPWEGGHPSHASIVPPGAAKGTATQRPRKP